MTWQFNFMFTVCICNVWLKSPVLFGIKEHFCR